VGSTVLRENVRVLKCTTAALLMVGSRETLPRARLCHICRRELGRGGELLLSRLLGHHDKLHLVSFAVTLDKQIVLCTVPRPLKTKDDID
jgi:hypothetical protein